MSMQEAFDLFCFLIFSQACRRAYAEERGYPEYIDLGGES